MNSASPKRESIRSKRMASILAAARTAFERDGFDATKISTIAADVGIAEGTVFHYFPTKRRLILSLIESFYQDITTQMASGISVVEGLRNRLHYIIQFQLNVIAANAAFCGAILQEARRMDNALTEDVRQRNRDYTQLLVDVLQQGKADGDIRASADVALVRNTVYGSIEHWLWSALSENRALEVEQTAIQLTDLIYTGICVMPNPDANAEIAKLISRLNTLLEQKS